MRSNLLTCLYEFFRYTALMLAGDKDATGLQPAMDTYMHFQGNAINNAGVSLWDVPVIGRCQ